MLVKVCLFKPTIMSILLNKKIDFFSHLDISIIHISHTKGLSLQKQILILGNGKSGAGCKW